MSVPAYIWLYNSTGTLIQGGSNVLLREGAIEMQSFNHGIHIPYDNNFGKLTGTRVHDRLSFTKEPSLSVLSWRMRPFLLEATGL